MKKDFKDVNDLAMYPELDSLQKARVLGVLEGGKVLFVDFVVADTGDFIRESLMVGYDDSVHRLMEYNFLTETLNVVFIRKGYLDVLVS